MTIAIIPARGGSKGIPMKNLAKIAGETLLARCLRTCHEAGLKTVVSSENQDILQHAKEQGAIPLPRPERLSTDDADTPSVLRHARDELGITDRIAFVQCTAPFLTVRDIRLCCEPCDEDLSVCVHPFHGFVMTATGVCLNQRVVGNIPRRQEMRGQYVISGSIWSFLPAYLDKPFYSGTIRLVESEGYRLDIDDYRDLRIAEKLCDRGLPAYPQ